jgi:hypothetical protein
MTVPRFLPSVISPKKSMSRNPHFLNKARQCAGGGVQRWVLSMAFANLVTIIPTPAELLGTEPTKTPSLVKLS